MPIARWICRGCSNREVPLDHFATTSCGDTVCHPDFAAALLADRNKQPVGVVRVTHGLSCARRAAIEAAEEFAIDPLDALPSMSGTGWHQLMEAHAPGLDAEVEVSGVIAGIKVVGHVDRLRPGVVEDWKVVQFLPKDGRPKPEHVVQTSVYGHMLGGIKRGRIWYKTHFDMRAVEFDLMPIEDAIAYAPYGAGAGYNVYDLWAQMNEFLWLGKPWQELPLAGKLMRFENGKTMCEWCAVREECTVAAMGDEAF